MALTRRGRRAVTLVVSVALVGGAAYGGTWALNRGLGSATGASQGPGGALAVTFPQVPAAAPVLPALSDAAERPAPNALAAALAAGLVDPALGAPVVGTVVDVATGDVLFAQLPDAPVVPASTAKLATGVAALAALGPDHRITTSVVAGAEPGTIVLVGGGDPTLAGPKAVGKADPGYPVPAKLTDLAAATVAKLEADGVRQVRLVFDATLYSGPATGPGWKPTYVSSGNVAPVSALEVDEGRKDPSASPRVADPAAAAGAAFAALLKAGGIDVVGSPAPGMAPAGAAVLASVSSPPMSALVDRLLQRSDNDLAEALGRQVAIHHGLPASFAGAAEATAQVLTSLGVNPAGIGLADNSGLSRDDRVTVAALVQLLRLAASVDHPQLRAVVVGLPVRRLQRHARAAVRRSRAGGRGSRPGQDRHVGRGERPRRLRERRRRAVAGVRVHQQRGSGRWHDQGGDGAGQARRGARRLRLPVAPAALPQQQPLQPPDGHQHADEHHGGEIRRVQQQFWVHVAGGQPSQQGDTLVERGPLDDHPQRRRVGGERVERRREQEHRQERQLDPLEVLPGAHEGDGGHADGAEGERR